MKTRNFIAAHKYNIGIQKSFFPKVNSLEEGLKDFIRRNPGKCERAKEMYKKFFKKEPEV